MSRPEGVGPLASLDRRDPLQGIGSLTQRWEAPLCKLQALPVWWLREPGALANDPGLTINTQSTKRKPEPRSSKARARRTQILFATHSVGDLGEIYTTFLGESLLDTATGKDLNTKLLCLSALCLGGFGMRGILESVKYHLCSHINSHNYLGLIDRDKLLRLCWMVMVKKEVVIWDFGG